MQNIKIRKVIQEAGVYHYRIAEYIGISDMTFLRWLRKPLSTEKEKLVLEAIKAIKATN